jgi:PAS domain S-box-containing protein
LKHNKLDIEGNKTGAQSGLFDRLFFLHLLSTTILFLIIVSAYYQIEKNSFNNNLMKKSILVRDILEISSVDPIVGTIAYDRIDQAIETLYNKNQEIVYIEIYDLTANIIAFVGEIPKVHIGIKEIYQLFEKDSASKYQADINQGFSELITFLDVGDRHLGLIRLGFTKKYLQGQLRRNIQYFLGLFILAIAVTSLIFYIVTNRWIVLPIINVSKIMKNYGKDDLPTLLNDIKQYNKSITKDEIGTMSTAFEWMVSSIIKRTEEKEKAEERFRLIAENVADVIWTMDMDLRFTFISPSIYQQRGYTFEEVMEHSLEETVLPDSFEKLMKIYIKRLAMIESGDKEGFDPIEYVVQQLCKDGSVIWTSTNARILLDQDDQPVTILGSTHDITKRKLAEEEKIKNQKIIADQKKMAFVGQIAGKMAHDFNNILGIIMGTTELSLLDCKDVEMQKALELIFKQTVRGKNLTKNLVAFAKDQEPKQEFFKINKKVDLVISLLKKDLEGIEIIKDKESDIHELLADPGMMEHGLVNLIQNSIHALSLVKHPKIIIRTYMLDKNLCLEIEDNGCGIPKEYIGMIYEPSFTLKGNRDKKGLYKNGIKGTGYGMANVKKYIEQHKGSISVMSKLGSGTKFTIKIPVIEKELTNKEKIEIREQLSHFDKYILLVEDEPAISDVQYRVLTQEPCNHKVDIANTGQAAMDLVNKNKYDFISLDYVLPGSINGMDVYSHIRKTNKTVPILFISGNIEFLESIKELKQKDANVDHLSKPCQNKDYVSGINKLLERTSTI